VARGRRFARAALVHWKYEPDLAALRDANRSGHVSPTDLESRRRLWRDLDELIKRIESNP
jgi:hypothetical protein